eukprot:COSAG02_NODE_104_length_36421_cov_132.465420_7_plen_59_part_00
MVYNHKFSHHRCQYTCTRWILVSHFVSLILVSQSFLFFKTHAECRVLQVMMANTPNPG